MKNINKNGFTLVELSIVLVIIGLLVGGVLQGRELIQAAERNRAIAGMTELSTAINTFRLQYDGFPGDFNEAEDYWTASDVANGNGNGKIGGDAAGWGAQIEFQQFWIHLIESGLYEMESAYSSRNHAQRNYAFAENTTTIVGHKRPLSYAYWNDNATFKMKNKHGLYLVAQGFTGGANTGFLSALDFLHPIDKKIDDGQPGAGNIITRDGANTPSGKNCVIDNTTDSNKYNLNSSTASDTCISMWYFE